MRVLAQVAARDGRRGRGRGGERSRYQIVGAAGASTPRTHVLDPAPFRSAALESRRMTEASLYDAGRRACRSSSGSWTASTRASRPTPSCCRSTRSRRDLAGARRRLALFLVQYWGGPTTYLEERGHPRLRARHFPFSIGELERDRWLVHMRAAIDASDAPEDARQPPPRLHDDGGRRDAQPSTGADRPVAAHVHARRPVRSRPRPRSSVDRAAPS